MTPETLQIIYFVALLGIARLFGEIQNSMVITKNKKESKILHRIGVLNGD